MGQEAIRNFSIIAHIDHGKSTLADRLLEKAGLVDPRRFRDQMLDDMDLERERGITIKARSVALDYELDGTRYRLNLIDTPGHVDFSYEVSRSLGACEGALLLVDAAQGVEAQTVANAYLAAEQDLTIIPVINKVDLADARPDEVAAEIEGSLGLKREDVLLTSARTGEGVDAILQAIVRRVPPPSGGPDGATRALVFDAVFDEYRGVIAYVRVVDGELYTGQNVQLMRAGTRHVIQEVGRLRLGMVPCERLCAGDVGYCVANIKSLAGMHVGDTLTDASRPAEAPLPGYREPQCMVYCGLFPTANNQYETLRHALERLRLNDSSFTYHPETSDALGFGFRCGFLGLLHMEIIQERLQREGALELVHTAPNVTYELGLRRGGVLRIENPAHTPDAGTIAEFREPVVATQLVVPSEAIGPIMQLCEQRRGTYRYTEYLSPARAMLTYELPLAEILYDFYDKLKSATRGYGTMDYELVGFRPADLTRLDIRVAGQRVDALSSIVHRSQAERRGRRLVHKLRGEISRHLFEVVIQASIGSRVIARESLAPLSKNVTGKCYGGDITRKRKLWAKQRAGKKKLKRVGQVEIPQEAFLAVLDTAS